MPSCAQPFTYPVRGFFVSPGFFVAIRANDKVQRLMHLDGKEAANEGLDDSWIDLCDYGAIGLALHRGLWLKPVPRPLDLKPHGDMTDLFVNGEKVASVATEVAVQLMPLFCFSDRIHPTPI